MPKAEREHITAIDGGEGRQMSTSASRRRPSVPPRAYIEHVVAFLLDYLDQLDGDPDLEDDNEDCCEARDDRGTRHGPWGIPAYAVRRVA